MCVALVTKVHGHVVRLLNEAFLPLSEIALRCSYWSTLGRSILAQGSLLHQVGHSVRLRSCLHVFVGHLLAHPKRCSRFQRYIGGWRLLLMGRCKLHLLSTIYVDHLLQLLLKQFIILCRPHEKLLHLIILRDYIVLLPATIYCIQRETASLH